MSFSAFLLLPGLESDAFADFGEHLRGDAEERGNGIERQVMHDAGATLQQQFVTLAGRGAVEVEVALVLAKASVTLQDAERRCLSTCSAMMLRNSIFSAS